MDNSSMNFGRNAFWGTVAKAAEESPAVSALRVVSTSGQEGDALTYAELCHGGLAAASCLTKLGVVAGSIVVTAVANTEGSVALSIGVARLGAVWAPADQDLTLEQIVRLLAVYEPAAAFLTNEHVDALSGQAGQYHGEASILRVPSWALLLASVNTPLPPERHVEDAAAATMTLTSGTTGLPKSVVIRTSALREWAGLSTFPAAVSPEALVYFGSPAWVSYLAMFLHVTSTSKELVLGQGYEKGLFFDALVRHRPPNMFFWPEVVVDFVTLPTQLQGCIASFAKTLCYGGARTPPTALLKLIQALPETSILQVYGSSEMGSISQLTPADHAAVRDNLGDVHALRRLESAGKCVGKVRIVDEHGEATAVGSTGSIQILPTVSSFKEYYRNPAATAAKWTADGWFISGDLGRFDEHGYLYLDGRDSETIVLLSGDNVYPNEIESVIAELPGVIEVAVAKVVASESAISEVGAFVRVLEGGELSVADVRSQCKRRLGQTWSHPTHIFIQTEKLPRNKNGKCMKALLSAQASAALTASAPAGGA